MGHRKIHNNDSNRGGDSSGDKDPMIGYARVLMFVTLVGLLFWLAILAGIITVLRVY